MKLLAIFAVLGTLVVAVSAAAASPVNGTDQANAARACRALRTADATAFSTQYASFGSCTSAWVAKAHSDRMSAQSSCKAKGLTGKQYAACVKSATGSSLATQTATAKNAAKACAAELSSLGKTAFEQKYGSNHNLRNAFGKCVSKQVSQKSASGGSGSARSAQHYAVSLSQLNGSGVSGTGTLVLNASKLTVKLGISGLEAGQSHAVTIRGLSSGTASCPTSSADANGDGLISLAEGSPYFGDQLLALDSAAQSGSPQTVSSALSPLATRTIVVQGMTVNGAYDATMPVACGVIVAR